MGDLGVPHLMALKSWESSNIDEFDFKITNALTKYSKGKFGSAWFKGAKALENEKNQWILL